MTVDSSDEESSRDKQKDSWLTSTSHFSSVFRFELAAILPWMVILRLEAMGLVFRSRAEGGLQHLLGSEET